MTVEGLIGDLLLQHNCVIVPAFGGFVAQRVSAQVDTVRGTIMPPRKAILFNRQLINNDGLLVSMYARQNSIDYAQAYASVTEAVSAWEQDLRQGKRISIDRVGFLYLDQERNLCFEQDRFYNLLLESYGLGAIHFVSAADVEAKTAHDAVQEMVKEVLNEPTAVEFQPEHIQAVAGEQKPAPVVVLPIAQAKKIKPWRYVAAAALLPIAFYSFWIPMKTDVLESGMLTLSDFNPFHKHKPAAYHPEKKTYTVPQHEQTQQLEHIPEGVSIFSYAFDEDTYIPVRIADYQSAPADPVTQSSAPVAATPTAKSSYIIVGCFSNRTNAENLVKTLRAKGFDAEILSGSGLTRVSAGNGADFASLNPKLQAEGLQGWILK